MTKNISHNASTKLIAEVSPEIISKLNLRNLFTKLGIVPDKYNEKYGQMSWNVGNNNLKLKELKLKILNNIPVITKDNLFTLTFVKINFTCNSNESNN